MTPQEINDLLSKTRDQKFRKKTEKQVFVGQAISTVRKGQESNHKGKTRPWAGKPRVNKSVEHHTEETKKKISKTKEEKNISLGITKKVRIKKLRRDFQTEDTKKKISKSIVELQGVKCFAIDPNGARYDFDTIKHCEIKLDYKNLTPNAMNIFPLDGSLKVGKRGRWKGWTFGRIV
jgi:hypothetical protein